MKWIAYLAASLWLVACPVAGIAQAPLESERVLGPYEELLSVLMAPFEDEIPVEQMALEFSRQAVASHPDLERAEAVRPGLTVAIAEAAKPVFTRFSARTRAAYRPRLLEALKSAISEGEAVSALEFYQTELARRLQQYIAEGLRNAEAVSEAEATAAFPARDVSDLARHTALVPVSLSPEEERALEESLRRFPVLVKLRGFTAAALPIRIAMVNERLNADDYAALGRAAEQGIARYRSQQL